MASNTLEFPTAGATDDGSREFHQAYNAWKYAQAQLELVLYAPEHDEEDPPQKVLTPLYDADTKAFERFMLCPVDRPGLIIRKLEELNIDRKYERYGIEKFLTALVGDVRRAEKARDAQKGRA